MGEKISTPSIPRRSFIEGMTAVAAGLGLSKFGIKSLEAKPVEAPQGEVIDGVETFGNANPYTQEQLNSLISEFNINPKEQRQDTYYGSIFVKKSVLDLFSQDNGESMQAFVKRNLEYLSQMLKDAVPPVVGGLNTRRLIILDENAIPPASYHEGYIDNGITDSDGTWFFDTRYIPANSSYYDPIPKVDRGLIHELGHDMLHLNDQYALDVHPTDISQTLRSRIPSLWQTYKNDYKKNVSSDDLMATVGKKMQQFTALQLNRRPNPHNLRETVKDYNGWNSEFPQSVNILLRSQGQTINPSEVKIYRTRSTGGFDKTIDDTVIYTGLLQNLNPNSLFVSQNGVINRTEATLLLEIKGTDGNTYWRWLDARDFNIAQWTNKPDMEIQIANGSELPENFDWTITYKEKATPTATSTTRPTETPQPTATATSTSEPSSTATSKPSSTAIPSSTATQVPTYTPTIQPSATSTPEPSSTAIPSSTATRVPTSSPTTVISTETPFPTNTSNPLISPTSKPEQPIHSPTRVPSVNPTEQPPRVPPVGPNKHYYAAPVILVNG